MGEVTSSACTVRYDHTARLEKVDLLVYRKRGLGVFHDQAPLKGTHRGALIGPKPVEAWQVLFCVCKKSIAKKDNRVTIFIADAPSYVVTSLSRLSISPSSVLISASISSNGRGGSYR